MDDVGIDHKRGTLREVFKDVLRLLDILLEDSVHKREMASKFHEAIEIIPDVEFKERKIDE